MLTTTRNSLVLSFWVTLMVALFVPACGGGDSYDGDVINTADTIGGDTSILEDDVSQDNQLPFTCPGHMIKSGDSCIANPPDDSPDATSAEEVLTDEVTTTDCAPLASREGNWVDDDGNVYTINQFVDYEKDPSYCYASTENFGVYFFAKKGEWEVLQGPLNNPKIFASLEEVIKLKLWGSYIGDTPIVLQRP